jgi:hypothetical protein
MKIRIVLLGILVVLAGVGCYLTRYEYFKLGRGDGIDWEFRTNRYTNETDALSGSGWMVVQTSKEWADKHWYRTRPSPAPEPLPAPENIK